MHFDIVSNAISPAVHQHSVQTGRVANYIDTELSARNYGYGVREGLFGFGCVGTGSLPTGSVTHKKYTKSRRLLLVRFTLNYSEVIQTEPASEEFTRILIRGLMATYSHVKAMAIPDFDVDSFYRDLEALLDKRGWKEDPERYEKSRGIEHGFMVHFQPTKPQDWVTEDGFWDLIDQSIEAVGENAEKQVSWLIEHLALKTENEMVGFETILWDLMKKSYHYNVLAFLELIDSRTSYHSQHINFRCRLILCGRKIFYAAIEAPNSIDRTLEIDPNARRLLDASNNAFIRAFGKRRGLPKDVADAWIDYEPAVIYMPRGEPWGGKKGFAKRYGALLARYGKPSGGKSSAPRKAEQEDVSATGRRKMPESEFWTLIQESMEATHGVVGKQIAHLKGRLAAMDEDAVIGFELTLRNLIQKSNHYNVAALLKAVNGAITDDSFLYFRCGLVLAGERLFNAAIEDPNKMTDRLDSGILNAEGLLYVADAAFLKGYGKDSDKDLPRSIGAAYYDYGMEPPPLGKPWNARDFGKRYAGLVQLYG